MWRGLNPDSSFVSFSSLTQREDRLLLEDRLSLKGRSLLEERLLLEDPELIFLSGSVVALAWGDWAP